MGTKYRGESAERLALDSYIKLMRATESVSVRVHRHLAEAGLTISQFAVLEALHHLGPLCQRDIARKVLKSTGNITMVIDNLERRGLVRRERGAADRRFLTIHLTPSGRGLVGELFPRHARAINDELAALTPDEQAELGRLCRKLGRND